MGEAITPSLFFLLVLIVGRAETSHNMTSQLEQAQCSLGGRLYAHGESWSPELPPFGVMDCINCTCKAFGTVACESEDCPSLSCRKQVTPPGRCCPVCKSSLQEGDDNTIPMATDSKESCIHGDTIYQHSQVFSSEMSGLQPTNNKQCVVCLCLDREVLCQLKTCPNITCSSWVYNNGDCCPSCPGNSLAEQSPFAGQSNIGHHNFGLTVESNPSMSRSCDDAREGMTWNPVIGAFGVMPCVVCRCQSGAVVCRRFWCVDKQLLPCQSPVKPMGECCESCPGNHTANAILDQCFGNSSRNSMVMRGKSGNHNVLVVRHSRDQPTQLYEWRSQRGSVHRVSQLTLTAPEEEGLLAALSHNEVISIGVTKKKVIERSEKKLMKQARRCLRRSCARRLVDRVANRFQLQPCL